MRFSQHSTWKFMTFDSTRHAVIRKWELNYAVFTALMRSDLQTFNSYSQIEKLRDFVSLIWRVGNESFDSRARIGKRKGKGECNEQFTRLWEVFNAEVHVGVARRLLHNSIFHLLDNPSAPQQRNSLRLLPSKMLNKTSPWRRRYWFLFCWRYVNYIFTQIQCTPVGAVSFNLVKCFSCYKLQCSLVLEYSISKSDKREKSICLGLSQSEYSSRHE